MDTSGHLLAVQVQPASLAAGPAARGVLTQALRLVPTLRKLWADSAYTAEALTTWLAEHWPRLDLEIVRRADGTTGFAVQPRRWVVERSFAWLGLNRLLSKEYERLPWHEEGWILCASITLLLKHYSSTDSMAMAAGWISSSFLRMVRSAWQKASVGL